ncbi:MAG: M2 family metallopeptidase [Planctomycetales bacterium]|nr:M2 family metallopeptidase [Planctomycetales bacterium]
MQSFIDRHVQKLDPLNARMNQAYYAAQVSGKREDFQNVQQIHLEINELFTNRKDFEFLQKKKTSGTVTEPRQQRQLEKLNRAFLVSQMDADRLKESIRLQTAIIERYNNYRGSIDGRAVTMTEIYRIMTQEKDVIFRQKAWRASKEVGPVIAEDYLRLVKMRNQLARQAGYADHHAYSIDMHEQSVEDMETIFDALARSTDAPFALLKEELDGILAETFKITVHDLRPWHYHDPFFQRTPLVYEIDLDPYYAERDVARLCVEYFAGIGLPVDDIMGRSDLYDKPGKNPHAFAIDVDRHGDVRILTNIANDERWMETTLHELGHALYFKHHDPREPYLLREPAHSFTTEAVAMFFGRLSRNAAWMQVMLGLTDAQRSQLERVTEKYLRFQQILFARWTLVMYHFEKSVYADPDQDINTRWWDLVEKYQRVNRPDGKPDAGWLSKLHFTVAPCYYHNYLLGELLVSQWYHYLRGHVLDLCDDTPVSCVGDKRIGTYFKDAVFAPGAVHHWNEMIRRSTGEPLNVSHFLKQFVQ